MNNPALFLCLTVIRLTTGKAETLYWIYSQATPSWSRCSSGSRRPAVALVGAREPEPERVRAQVPVSFVESAGPAQLTVRFASVRFASVRSARTRWSSRLWNP